MQEKVAFLFPGQGSQSVNMLSDLAACYPIVKETFEEASQTLRLNLWEITQGNPPGLLDQTEYTQPLLLTANLAIQRVWEQESGLPPCLLAGHSLGEYSALVCAKSLVFAETIQLVAKRGRYMQEAVPAGRGAMAAIVGLSEQTIEAICQEASQGQILSPANYNTPDQIVLAGEIEAINRAIALAKQAKAKLSRRLAVSVPAHCALMQPAALHLADTLSTITCSPPSIPVINNVDTQDERQPIRIKEALLRQIYHPVRWVRVIQMMIQQDVTVFIECGPGKVLAGLNKSINATVPIFSIGGIDGLHKALQTLSS